MIRFVRRGEAGLGKRSGSLKDQLIACMEGSLQVDSYVSEAAGSRQRQPEMFPQLDLVSFTLSTIRALASVVL
jgi:hypothetical protein